MEDDINVCNAPRVRKVEKRYGADIIVEYRGRVPCYTGGGVCGNVDPSGYSERQARKNAKKKGGAK